MGCKKCSTKGLTDEQKAILTTLAATEGEPKACKEIAEMVGLKSNAVSCRIRSLKNKGYVTSPERCKYIITEEGKQALLS